MNTIKNIKKTTILVANQAASIKGGKCDKPPLPRTKNTQKPSPF
jgi:hypothetical protein